MSVIETAADARGSEAPARRAWRMSELLVVLALAGATVVIAVWTAGMALQLEQHWWQWVGFDAVLITATAVATWLARRRDPRLAVAAAAVGTLAFADGWFDLFTAPADYAGTALLTAVTLEWPFALFGFGVALWATRRTAAGAAVSGPPGRPPSPGRPAQRTAP